MKKLNVSFIDDGKKEDAILKIKDDSFSITTKDNSIIKIPYSDIKDYEYTQDEKLIIKRKHSSDIVVEVSFDTTLINTLKEIVKNSNVQSQPIYEKEEVNTKAENLTKPFKENVEQNTSNENQNNNSSGNNIFKTISAIISVIIVIVMAINLFGNGGSIEGGSEAEYYALKEIPETVLTFDDVMSNELKCEAKEKTDDEIILVKCTTTNKDVIKHYDSEVIWYGYQETADGRSHYRSINKSKDKVLENMRK